MNKRKQPPPKIQKKIEIKLEAGKETAPKIQNQNGGRKKSHWPNHNALQAHKGRHSFPTPKRALAPQHSLTAQPATKPFFFRTKNTRNTRRSVDVFDDRKRVRNAEMPTVPMRSM